MILLDVDFFKAYNDHYGHPAGDDALRRIAQMMRQSVICSDEPQKRDDVPDRLIARHGGEEFAIILSNCSAICAHAQADALRALVRAQNWAHAACPTTKVLTISAGVAAFEPHRNRQATPEDLIEEADKQLYLAKAAGRNCVMPARKAACPAA